MRRIVLVTAAAATLFLPATALAADARAELLSRLPPGTVLLGTVPPAGDTNQLTPAGEVPQWRRFGFPAAAATIPAPVPPKVVTATSVPPALARKVGIAPPRKVTAQEFDFDRLVTAHAVFAVDTASREVLLSHNADDVRSIASMTKLMTAMVALESGPSLATRVAYAAADNPGGAALRVPAGTSLSFNDWLYAMVVGSANNAANVVAKSTGLSRAGFVAAMDAKAKKLGLVHTRFADPSGIEVNNLSTAREVVAMALEAFDVRHIRRMATTAKYSLTSPAGLHTLKNTNELLTDPDNGLYVLGGKTGYIDEAGWNLVATVADPRVQRSVTFVVMGSGDKKRSFEDAQAVVRWLWNNYAWN